MSVITVASKRYVLRSLLFAAMFVGTIYLARQMIRGEGVSGPLAYAIALLPGIAAVGLVWATGRLIAETDDEFLRMLAVRQQLIATGFAISIACVWGTLETFGLVPHVEAFYILVLWAAGVLVGMVANVISHGAGGP